MSDFDFICELFGYYVAYWSASNKVQFSNFETLFDALLLMCYFDCSWVIYKQYKFIGRSATYLGV